MDIREGEFYAFCSRLKTKRTKKRLQKKDLEKQLIRIHKRLWKVRAEQRTLGYKELVPPVQKGWKRFFVLREDVAQSADALFFQQLLDKINVTQYSFRKDFKVRKKQKGKKVDVQRSQHLQVIESYQLKKLKFTEKEWMYFRAELRYNSSLQLRTVYVFTDPWRFVLKVGPHLLTHVRIIEPALVSEEKEIMDRLVQHDLFNKMDKLKHGSVKYSRWKTDERMKYKSLFKTESVAQLLATEINNH